MSGYFWDGDNMLFIFLFNSSVDSIPRSQAVAVCIGKVYQYDSSEPEALNQTLPSALIRQL